MVNREKGMTLLEVMVALFIFAMTGTAILKASGDHLNGLSQIEEVTFATWIANNRLNELKLNGSWPPKNNLKGKEDMADRTWYWQQQVRKTNDDDLRAVDIVVGLDPEYTSSVTTVTTYIAKPADKVSP